MKTSKLDMPIKHSVDAYSYLFHKAFTERKDYLTWHDMKCKVSDT